MDDPRRQVRASEILVPEAVGLAEQAIEAARLNLLTDLDLVDNLLDAAFRPGASWNVFAQQQMRGIACGCEARAGLLASQRLRVFLMCRMGLR